MTVLAPCDAVEVKLATGALLEYDGPAYMQTGRSPQPAVHPENYAGFSIGKGEVLMYGEDVTIIACGVEVHRAKFAAVMLAEEGISAKVINMPSIKPIDTELIEESAKWTGAIVTAEDHNVFGGLGSAVAEVVAQTRPVPMEFVGIQDVFGQSGESEQLATEYGLMAPDIAEACRRVLKRKENGIRW